MQAVLEGFRLSPQQRRVWRWLRDSGGAASQAAFVLGEGVDPGRLAAAVAEVVARHEILRTVYPRLAGMDSPLQVVQEPPLAFEVREERAAGDPWSAVDVLCREGRPFDLEQGPIVRCELLSLASGVRVLLISLPALAADASTLEQLAAEIARRCAPRPEEAEAAEVAQYIDFSEWQNELTDAEEASEGRQFWKEQKLAAIPRLDLPFERPVEGGAFDPRYVRLDLAEEIAGRLPALAGAASEESLLLGLWQVLLWRIAGQAEGAVSAYFHGREIEQLREALGIFGGYLPVPFALREDLRLRELAEEIERRTRGMRSRLEHFPWEGRAGIVDPAYLAGPPITFEYRRFLDQIEPWPGLLTPLLVRTLVERFRLGLFATRRGDSLSLELAYDASRLDGLAVRRLAGQLESLLAGALVDGGRPVGGLSLLGEAERQMLVFEWNDTARDWREWDQPFESFTRRFEQEARQSPESPAVASEGGRLTFGELNAGSNRLARYLTSRGVGRESRVGVLVDRSVEVMVWILGVLKAGGAYVPLDGEQPRERLRLMVEELGLRWLLAREPSGAGWSEPGLEVLIWETIERDLAGLSGEDLGLEIAGSDLAYVLFTSGSTGRPKGVMVHHAGLANLAQALEERVYRGLAGARVAVNAPLVFDGSVKQWAQLAWGRPLEMIPESVRPDGEALWSYLRERKVSVLDSTPSQLRLLLDGGLERAIEGPLARVLVGGEEIAPGLWSRLGAAGGGLEYHNVYGPTECTVDATSTRVVAGEAESIGRPLGNVRVYLLDASHHAVPLGLAGEICVGGAGLARGYVGRAELTAERFIPDALSGEPGGRLYRTGDLGRHLPDGRLEFLGRIDRQVKLRGVRIELGEIESVLEQHARVRAAVALLREDRPGDRRLVGYVMPRSGAAGMAGSSGAPLYALPNGLEIAQLNRIETDYLYQEIFEQSCYLRHGVTLPADACVLDVGANIGMFTLFVGRESPGARIYAFEPIGAIHEALRVNASRSGASVTCLPYGLGEAETRETFVYYPQFSARSGLSEYADAASEIEVIKRFIGNEERLGVEGAGELLAQVDELVADRFVGELEECRVRRLSSVLREEGISRVDLLKIDVQRAEQRVLEGIDEEDWSLIGQVAMEVHDDPTGASAGRVEWIVDLLTRQGFSTVVEQDELLVGTDRYNVFAVRPGFARWRAELGGGSGRGGAALVEVGEAGGGEEDLYILPNRLRIAQQNRNESEFIYQQIFVDEVYQRHGVEIWEGDRIFDVGANIGLFTLYAHQWRGVEVYAFEPIPSTFERLESNVRRYGLPAHLYRCGLGRERTTARFTFYPKWTASSSQYADEAADLASAREFLVNRDRALESYADEILEGRFSGEVVECELRTLSEVLRESGVDRVDLLKLDVEKSELDVLLGLAESDWPKVQQMVIELHDLEGRLGRIRSLLDRHGFTVAVEQDELAVGTAIYTLYARRPEHRAGARAAGASGGASRVSLSAGGEEGPELTVAELKSYLAARLPEFMLPSDLVLLAELPYTRSGKVDRRALPAPEEVARAEERAVLGPRDPFEEVLVGIWSEVLQRSPLGVEDNFFALGGHSLLATQLISRVRGAFSIDLPLRSLFEHPTVAELALEVRRAMSAGEGSVAPPIQPVPRTGDLPLSFAQQRLWFIDQLDPGSAVYNSPHPLRLRGPLDLGILARTLEQIVRRHESLRTRFSAVDGRPVQVIDAPFRPALPRIDLGALAAGRREAEALRLALEEARRPFDLARGPLLRAGAVRLAADEHVVLFDMHHIVSDGRSMEVLVREVAALYRAFQEGRPSPLPELPIQYADFAHWQRSWLAGETLAREVQHWRERLAGAPAILALPLDRPRSPRRDPRSDHRLLRLERPLAEALRGIGRRRGATTFMTFLAGAQALLARYSGQDDVCVGVPIAGRNRAETEGLIGFFVNTLVMRGSLAGDPSFDELLGRVKESALAAYAHQEVPFDKLVEELAGGRDLGVSPLFQVMFSLEDNPSRGLDLPGLSLEPLPVVANVIKLDLMLGWLQTGDELSGWISFATALFDGTTIRRLGDHLVRLLGGAAAAPERAVAELALWSPAERQQAIVEWGKGGEAAASEIGFHQAFASQAATRPGAVALEVGGETLTYGELERRANRLAQRLRRLGVEPEVRVGVCLERTPELVVSLLAVLKAGGVYVPIDPGYPAARRTWMAADAGLAVVLVQGEAAASGFGAAEGAAGKAAWRVLDLAADAGRIAAMRETAPASGVGPGHLAYLIYTSGTTGRPKGVMVEHRHLLQTLSAAAERFPFEPGERMLCLASFAFDISLFELGLPLLAGARVRLLGREEVLDPSHLVESVAASAHLHAVPSLMRSLVDAFRAHGRRAGDLRTAFVGGEAVDADLLAGMREVFPAARLEVLYGPTEATIICASQRVPEHGGAPGRRLGRPLSGVDLGVVDRRGLPVPVGAAGELWVGGAAISRGYLGWPELTADRYRPAAGGRRYRTGDLARYLADGSLEFLGRIDGQVKVRGFRIEPAEVEAALAAHPRVREAAVVVRGEGAERGLAAFVAAAAGALLSADELREHAARHLPPHMVPSSIEVLDALPLSPVGKVDRRALAERAPAAAGEAERPRTLTEEMVAALWSEVLRRERVGAHDNFFELGGHSLLATQLIARLRQTFAVELPLRALFERPTVAGVARAVEEAQRAGLGLVAPPLVPADRTSELPLSFAQERLWFIDQLAPGQSTYNMPLPLRIEGALSPDLLARSLGKVVERHEALRTRFESRQGRPVQVIDAVSAFTMSRIDLDGLASGRRDIEVARLVAEEGRRPFDLARGPLLRAALLRLEPESWGVLFDMHHVVSDGWSMDVLVREIGALYSGYARGEEPALPPLPVQYADFAVWQRRWLSGEVLASEIAYWRGQVAGVPTVLDLHLDRPRRPVEVLQGAVSRLELSEELAASLRGLARREGATLFMVLLAAWQALLGRLGGAERLAVGTPVAGRNRLETEGLIGFFVNTLVLPADLSGEPSFLDLVRRSREVCLGAFAHQDLPFEKLVEELQPERSLSHGPLVQAMFTLQSASPAPPPVSGLKLTPLVDSGSDAVNLKFDLDLGMAERAEGSVGGLAAALAYNRVLFDGTTAARLLAQLGRLLAGLVADAEGGALSLPLLSAAERHQVAVEWNDTESGFPGTSCLDDLFAAQVRETPEALAVVAGEERWSYGELDRRVEGLARRLAALGVGPESVVALCFDRSAAMIAAVLAVWRAGAAFVPLDPGLPGERLGFLLADSGARLLLTLRPVLRDLPALPEPPLGVVCLDEEAREAPAEAGSGSRSWPESLAYVLYTSGSTGQPKGTLVSQRSILHALWAVREATFGSRPRRVGLNSAWIFDPAIEQILHLLVGATLVLVPEEARSSGEGMVDLLSRERLDLLDGTPAQVKAWLEAGLLERPGAVPAEVLVGGEALDEATWRALSEASGTVFWNLYGPTECTVDSTVERVSGARVLLGRPLPRVRAYVLDRAFSPQPLGVPGELCLSGAGVTRGYLGRPDLTAERFLPDPFGAAGSRLYRTGDLARTVADGRLEFLGRVDRQVKLRGVRVELGEVESVLAGHPGVRGVAAEVVEGASGPRLVAYVAGEVSGAELREHARRRLPEAMVPSLFVALPELPLTPQGKVDRRALPAPELARGEWVAPRTPAEELVAGIVAEVLKLDLVGAEESFFELGGHSLLATQLVSRLRRAFDVELPLRAVFEHPTVAGLARAVESARRAGLGLTAPPLVPVGRTGDLPLSFAQERLWFLDQLEPGRATYNMPLALLAEGDLAPEVLERSLSRVVARHETLRTRFASRQGRPVQVVDPPSGFALAQIDLSGLAAEPRTAEARRLAAAEGARPFDLARGPLLRGALLRLAAAEWGVLLTLHHVVSDGWSLGLLMNEVSTLYSGLARGEEPALPALPIQYADFTAWQRGWLSGDVLAAEIAYWRARLAGVPPVLDLPLDRPRPPVQALRGGFQTLELPLAVSASLRELARRDGATLFMVLLAVWQTLLGRLAGAERLAVGTPIAGRNHLETEKLIGFFVNTLVMPLDLSGEPTFQELLSRSRESCLGAYAHQDLPFEKLVEELQPERSLAHAPLVQAVLALHHVGAGADAEAPGLAGVRLSPLVDLGARQVDLKFDLQMGVAERGEGLRLSLAYDRTLFDGTTASRLLGQLGRLLAGAAAAPEARALELPLWSEAERQQVTVEWAAGAATAAAPELSFHAAFSAQAARRPEAPALTVGGVRWSYGELESWSNRLAHRLRELGVGPELRVGVCLERTAELVTSLLAVLKAGGVYVPIDPGYPPARRSWMAEDAGLALAIVSGVSDGDAPVEGAGQPVPVLDLGSAAERERIAARSDWAPAAVASPSSLAYLIYTSGTTGLPKGVMVEHRQLMQTLTTAGERVSLQPGERMASMASFSFDISLLELGLPLLAGGEAVLLDREEILDPVRRLAAIEGVEHLHAVPSLMRPLVESLRARAERSVSPHTVLVGGEAVEGDLLAAMREVFPRARLEVLYGPTETAIICASERVEEEVRSAGRRLGRPLPGVELSVVDALGRPVPLGAAGELWVGGAGVSRGYLGRPELTAERFRPSSGGRSYRTGDLARHLPDGRLEFLGRIDAQVKVRGFRIEPGEVEAALLAHPAVREAAVVVPRREGGEAGEAVLVAYVAGSPELTSAELRRHASSSLPPYMVPSSFVVLASLPLAATGKVDRGELSRRALPEEEGEPAAPRTATEELVAAIWSEVLRRERVGVADNFFELGGHSLLATQLLSRLREAFAVDLPLRAVFEQPMVAGLARAVDEARRAGLGLAAPPLSRADRAVELPLSFAQERLWFLHQLDPASTAYNLFSATLATGPLAVAALWRSLAAIERRHETLRTTFEAVDGRPFQRIREPFAAGSLIDLGALPAERARAAARALAAAEAARPFDLARGPLLRFALVRLEAREHVALLSMHHAISDEWSMGIFVRELAALYAGFREGRPHGLPELPVQYADYAAWQRGWLAGEALERQVAYWRERLAGAPALSELPLDRPRPAVLTTRGGSVPFALPAAIAGRLRRFSREQGATVFMALAALVQALLARHATRADVPLGTPVAGRGRLEVEGLIGFFVNTLVLRTPLDGEPGLRELVARSRETTLGAHEHQDLPFEKLVEELRPERSLAHSPLFQVMLTFQNAPRDAAAASDLTLQPFGNEGDGEGSAAALFDLTFLVQEGGETLRGSLDYRRDLFDAATARRLAERLGRLAEAALDAPDRSLFELDLLSAPERHALLVEWSSIAAADDGRGASLVERLRRHVRETPEAPALVTAGRTVAYGELGRESAALAAELRRRGAGLGTLVAVCLERSPELVVALVAVLEAGAAFLPLDPAYPRERLAYMLEDSGAALAVTTSDLAPRLPQGAGGPELVLLDRLAATPAAPAAASFDLPAPEDPAYVIYTSGSTGKPKGVLLQHAGLGNLSREMARGFGVVPASRFLQFASPSFDAAVAEIASALGAGAALAIAPREALLPGDDLVCTLRELAVTVAILPPSVLAATPPDGLPELATVISAGEGLPPAVAARWAAGRRMINAYGPTEATVCATLGDVSAEMADGARVPIGWPLGGAEVLVLDARLAPVPLGAPGELAIGGVGLAAGYLGRPELTAERFRPHPGGTPGARIYRTGDLARQLPDGRFDHLGRVDRQVKVRGVRIEPGEIEAALARLPGVGQVAVVARELAPGDVRLVAYLAGRPAMPGEGELRLAMPAEGELRAALAAELPESMLPGAFVVLPALPLTASGKLDLATLPLPMPVAGGTAPAPADPLEAKLVAVWQEILERPVGVEESFFDLGGHSLLAVRLVSKVEQETGEKLPLSALFQAPTVRRMAEMLRGRQRGEAASCIVPIRPRGAGRPLVLFHPVGGNLFCYREIVNGLGGGADGGDGSGGADGRPIYGIQAVGLDGREAPFTHVEDMAERYVAELLRLDPAGPYHLAGWSSGGVIAYEVARQLRARGAEVASLALVDTRVPAEEDRSVNRDPALLLNLFALDFGLSLDSFKLSWEEIRELPATRQLAAILETAKAAGVVPPEVEAAQVARYFEIFKANVLALSSYRPRPYPGRLLMLRTSEPMPARPLRPGAAAWERASRSLRDLYRRGELRWQLLAQPSLGWKRWAEGGVEVETVPGSHVSVLRPPHAGVLAERLRAWLAKEESR